jgi:hypothetical protein
MRMGYVLAVAASLALNGCGASSYFDQHPPNIRPESEAVDAVLGVPRTVVAPPEELARAPQQTAPRSVAAPAAQSATLDKPSFRTSAPKPAVAAAAGENSPPTPLAEPSTSTADLQAAPAGLSPAAAASSAATPQPGGSQSPTLRSTDLPQTVSGTSLDSSAASPSTSSLVTAHCEEVAKTRADDVAAAGAGSATQRVVHDGTYANCMAWESAHGGPQ